MKTLPRTRATLLFLRWVRGALGRLRAERNRLRLENESLRRENHELRESAMFFADMAFRRKREEQFQSPVSDDYSTKEAIGVPYVP